MSTNKKAWKYSNNENNLIKKKKQKKTFCDTWNRFTLKKKILNHNKIIKL